MKSTEMFAAEKEMNNEKRRCEIEEIISDNVETFKDVLHPHEFNTFRDKNGNNLLQIAIIQGKTEAFDYILSLDNFPLDSVNCECETALMTAVKNCSHSNEYYFSSRLINKGATLDSVYKDGDTLLMRAIENSHEKTSLLLIYKGVDVNTRISKFNSYSNSFYEVTPLRLALGMQSYELVAGLLCNGALCDVSDYAYSMIRKKKCIQEMLFDFVFDNYTESVDVNFSLLLQLKYLEAFERVIPYVHGIIVDFDVDFYFFWPLLDCETWKVLVTKYDHFARMFLACFKYRHGYFRDNSIDLVKLDIILGSSVGHDVIRYMQKSSTRIKYYLSFLIHLKDDMTEAVCLLLSYGLEVKERYLDIVYKKHGFCDLFRFLLHMYHPLSSELCGVASLFYNVSSDLNKFLPSYDEYLKEINHFLEHSAHPRLQKLYSHDKIVEKNLPKIPLLVELARNSVRKFLVDSYGIKNFRELDFVLSKLPICKFYREIITLERKLY